MSIDRSTLHERMKRQEGEQAKAMAHRAAAFEERMKLPPATVLEYEKRLRRAVRWGSFQGILLAGLVVGLCWIVATALGRLNTGL